ncbi:hypothetical protein ACP179_02310 (plasmid) [Xenorhabdus stockiae]|uniref:hypothetical protein n=1 Tax=Xenorhabdus stockiae TaxID=351614 RepID=UPI003CE98E18
MESINKKNDQLAIIHTLSKFEIKLHSGFKEANVYANRRMQVGVYILIQAKDDNDRLIQLSDEQLDSIQLINHSTGNELSGEWVYNSIENNYSHTFPDDPPLQRMDSLYEEKTNKTPQHKLYWILTSKTETMKIGAQIILNNKKYNTMEGTPSNSHVVIISHPEINYISDNLIIEEQKDIKSGKYKFEFERYIDIVGTKLGGFTHYYKWNQTNYYIKSKNGFPVKDSYIWNTVNDDEPSNIEFRRFSYLTNNDNLYLFFIWGIHQEKNKIVGHPDVNKEVSIPSGDFAPPTIESTTASIQVHLDTLNPHSDAVSITKLYFESPQNDFWGTNSHCKPYFYFHDIYGNRSGHIRVIINEDHQSFHLQDADND